MAIPCVRMIMNIKILERWLGLVLGKKKCYLSLLMRDWPLLIVSERQSIEANKEKGEGYHGC